MYKIKAVKDFRLEQFEGAAREAGVRVSTRLKPSTQRF